MFPAPQPDSPSQMHQRRRVDDVMLVSRAPDKIQNAPAWLSGTQASRVAWREAVDGYRHAIECDPLRRDLPRIAYTFLLEAFASFRPGFLGQSRASFTERLTRWFGPEFRDPSAILDATRPEQWQICHRIGDQIVPKAKVLQLYTDGYIEFFRRNPSVLEWVTSFRDVYDTDPSNVNSGDDFARQEKPEKGEHIHDIAIRRAVSALRKRFSDDPEATLLKIRGKPSEGHQLSPGVVPFHKDIEFLPMPGSNWWHPGTIEDFYQATRTVRVGGFSSTTAEQSVWTTHESRPDLATERVACRFVHRILGSIKSGTINLGELSCLPWILDQASFPLEDWQYRTFTEREMCDVMLSACEIFRQLATHCDEALADKIRPSLKALGRLSKYFAKVKSGQGFELEENDSDLIKNFSTELKGWTDSLPLLAREIDETNRLPIFLARDSLGVIEYLQFTHQIVGEDYVDHRVMYLPGSPEAYGRNKRQTDCTVESVYLKAYELFEATKDAVDADSSNPSRQDYFLKLAKDWIRGCVAENSAEGLFFRRMYHQLVSSLDDRQRDILIVDTQGTGKTVLLIRAALEACAEEDGREINVEALLGRNHATGLGVNSVDRLYKKRSEQLFEDLRWPFVFSGITDQPTFQTVTNLSCWLQLLWRSMNLYNVAVTERHKSLSNT